MDNMQNRIVFNIFKGKEVTKEMEDSPAMVRLVIASFVFKNDQGKFELTDMGNDYMRKRLRKF